MTMYMDVYDTRRKKYDFTDDTEILSLTYCELEEIPEDERKKLEVLSRVRKGYFDFHALLFEMEADRR